MAIKGQKRASEAKASETSAKKRCAGLAKVLAAGAGGFPGELTSGLAIGALLTYKEERHALQNKAIGMVAEALAAARVAKKKELAERESEVAGADREKSVRAEQLAAANTHVAKLAEVITAKKAELNAASDAVEAAVAVLSTAKKTQKQGDKELVAAELEKGILDGAGAGLLVVQQAYNAGVRKLAKRLGCDKALVDALEGALKQAPDSRSAFGHSTIAQYGEILAAKSGECAAIIAAGAAGKGERAAAVEKANGDRMEADATQHKAQVALDELEAQLAQGKKDAKAADARVKHYFSDMKVLMDGLDKMRGDMKSFIEGPVADFESLKELSPPPPPPVEEVPAVEAEAPAVELAAA